MVASFVRTSQDGPMDISIRGIENDELEGFIRTCEAAFSWDVHPNDMKSMKAVLEPDRCWVAELDGRSVGTGANYSFELTVPGARIPAAGLTMVGVLPSHRRRGALTALMRTFLEEPRSRGESVSILWASETVIYQRFGFGCASYQFRLDIERSRMAFLDDPGPEGKASMINIHEAAAAFPPIYEQARAIRPGFIARSETWWKEHRLRDHEHDRDGGSPFWCVVIETDGAPSAYAFYRVHPGWTHDGVSRARLNVHEAISTTPRSARELWRFLFGVDLIERVTTRSTPVDDPLPMTVTDPRWVKRLEQDALWLRVLDVPKALAGRDYSSADRLILGISDAMLPDNDGSWILDTTGEDVVCIRTADYPDISMDVRDLGAMYLGGTNPHTLHGAGRLQTNDPSTIERLRAMMASPLAPWYPEIF